MSPPIRILAVNQNRILRDGLCMLIEMQPDLDLVASAADGDAAISLFADRRPDVTLMDLDLPGHTGVDAIHRIRGIDPHAWVIGLLTFEGDKCGREAMEAGATAILAKDRIGEMLLPLIRAERDSARRYEIPMVLELSSLRVK